MPALGTHITGHQAGSSEGTDLAERPEPALGPCWPHTVGGAGPALGKLTGTSQSGRDPAQISAPGLPLPLYS